MKQISDTNNLTLYWRILVSFIIGVLCALINLWLGLGVLFCCINLAIYRWIKKREANIEALTLYLQRLNQGDYQHDILAYKEGELAKLHAQLNRTTVHIQAMNQHLTEQKSTLRHGLEDVSHQLKTPLASLQILNDLQNQDDELVSKSKEQIQRLQYLTQSLLKLIKLESKTANIKVKNNCLESCVMNCLSTLEPLIAEKGLCVHCDFKKSDAMFDWFHTMDAILNVLSNKLRYAKSEICISTETHGYLTILKISDDGETIDTKDRNRIFDRFYSGLNRSPESIGIGLSIAREIMNQQAGSLVVRDKNTFVFTFNRI